MKFTILSGLILLFVQFHGLAQVNVPLDRYRTLLLEDKVSDRLFAIIQREWEPETACWADVDYEDQARTGWKTALHLKRIKQLAKVYADREGSHFREQELAAQVEKALRYWLDQDFRNPNWFQNDIAVPSGLRDIYVLMGEELDEELRARIRQRLAEREYKSSSGSNLVWLADIKLHLGFFTQDEALIRESLDLIGGELKTGAFEGGIQPDFSFLFHKNRLQMYAYGYGLLSTVSRIAWQVQGTEWALAPEKIALLGDFVLQGWQWMARGPYTIPGTMDRASSRKSALTKPRIPLILEQMQETDPDRKQEYRRMDRAQQDPETFDLQGIRNFPYADLLVSHRSEGSVFIKMLSDRNLPTESINSENLQGKFLNAGNTYFLKTGKEYTNLLPFWDWDLLPGFTYVEGAARIRRGSFTGSMVDNKERGSLSVMDYALLDGEKELLYRARKAWFVHGDLMLALIAPLKLKEGQISQTALDQSRWQGEAFWEGEWNKTGGQGSPDEAWVMHGGFAYYSPGGKQQLHWQNKKVSASWAAINNRYRHESEKQEQVFLPLLSSTGEAQSYAVLSVHSPSAAAEFFTRKPWKVIQNDSFAQAVLFEENLLMVAIYQKDYTFKYGDWEVPAREPGLWILDQDKIQSAQPMP